MARLRMANILNGKAGGGMIAKGAATAVAAAGIDGASEYFRIPVLNDESNLFPGRSNAEVILYGAGAVGLVLSGVAMLSKQRVFGNVGAELFAPSAGLLAGTYAWENIIAPAVLRNQTPPVTV